MNDDLFNLIMGAFAAMMLWVAFYRPIHTGFFGSIGCLGIAMAAILSMDNSVYRTVDGTESVILLMCGSIGLIVLHVVLTISRAKANPKSHPLRRRDDFIDTDWGEDGSSTQIHRGSGK